MVILGPALFVYLKVLIFGLVPICVDLERVDSVTCLDLCHGRFSFGFEDLVVLH